MRYLASVSIGRKMAFMIGAGLLQLVLVVITALWAMNSIDEASERARQAVADRAMSEHITALIVRIGLEVGDVANSNKPNPDAQARIVTYRKEWIPALEALKNKMEAPEAKRLLTELDQSANTYREANVRILALAADAKYADAARLHRSAFRPAFDIITNATLAYQGWQDRRVSELDKERTTLRGRLTWSLIIGGLLMLVVAALFGSFVARSISAPIAGAVSYVEAVASGDLTKDLSEEYTSRGDEIGTLARAMQSMSSNLRNVVTGIASTTKGLTTSSTQMAESSNQMSAGSRNASEKAHSVAVAAEEMSSNVTSIAVGMEETTTNLTSVTVSTEQMTATIGEIASNSERARRITAEARNQAVRITEQMSHLGEAASEIGKVTETITEISAQTNLLALNAAIEAARAGAAGKGFAVVASEIKELAQQTAAATQDIRARVESVQNSTNGGIAEIQKVSSVIHEVSDLVGSIATAIEEQATVTRDISRNIAEASNGVSDANIRISECSQVSQEIARDIQAVERAASDMASGSVQVGNNAQDLSKAATQLSSAVGQFRL